MKTSGIFASDIIFSNTIDAAERAMGMARREHNRLKGAADRLFRLGRDSAKVGNRLEKHIFKKLRLNRRNGGGEVMLKAGCAYEAANFAIQLACFLRETADKIKREARLYQKAGAGAYVPSEARRTLRAGKRRKGRK